MEAQAAQLTVAEPPVAEPPPVAVSAPPPPPMATTAAVVAHVVATRPSPAPELGQALQGLEDENLLAVLQGVLQDRTGVLQALVDWAVPGLVYIPSKAITERRIMGVIKSYSPKDGYGFIACPEVQEVFGCDVFLHASQMGQLGLGDRVNFAVLLNKDQKPQAFDVALGEPGSWDSKQQAANLGGAAGKGLQEWGGKGKGYGKPWDGYAEWDKGAKGWDKGWGKGSYYGGVDPWNAATWKGGGVVKGAGAGVGATAGAGREMPGVTDRRWEGAIKNFNRANGYGFIACDELSAIFGGSDVFVHHAQIGVFQIGEVVNFSVILNKDQKPQAMDLRDCEAAKRQKVMTPLAPPAAPPAVPAAPPAVPAIT